jgi:dihydroorotase
MKILLKNATILDPSSPFHSSTQDLLIQDGKIAKISQDSIDTDNIKVIEHENLHVSKGWFDSGVSFGEPGYEERETLDNGLSLAASSGFTKILLNPDIIPIPDSGATISYLMKMGQNKTTSLYPIGALTEKGEGKQLASLYDMHKQGAIGFGDYKSSLSRGNLLKIALQYAQSFDGTIFSHPLSDEIAKSGVMHEGKISARIGVKGIPSLAETIQIARDLQILLYTEGKLHIPLVSSEKSLSLIRSAKKQGLNISCSVGLPNLIFDDTDLESFDTNFKVFPPIRSKTDQLALRTGLLDGTIDMVSSMHEPMNIEHKKLEFEHSAPGTIGLESCFGLLCNIFPLDKVLSFLTRGTECFELQSPSITEGNAADLTWFNPEKIVRLKLDDLKSTSKNCAYLRLSLQGKVLGSFNNNLLTTNS